MDIEALIATLVGDLAQVPGVAALVLGGARARGTPVDILYRDLDAIAAVARAGVAGRPRSAYQPGHPHGFIAAIYLAEIALCRPLWDPEGVVADLKRLADLYPAPLQAALIRQFSWEAAFALRTATKRSGARTCPTSRDAFSAACLTSCRRCSRSPRGTG